MTFTAVRGSGQQRPQRLIQRRVGDPELARVGVDDVFGVVEQDDHAARRNRVKQRPHQRRGSLVRVTVTLQQPVRGLRREQPAQVGEQVREVHRVRPGRAQVDDPVHAQLTQVIGEVPALQRLEQPAHHRGLADPAPPDHGHQPRVVRPQEVSHQLGLDVPVLEVARRDHRRRVHELRPGRSSVRTFGLPLPLESGGDPLLGTPGGRLGVGQQPLLAGDAPAQILDVLLDPRPPGRVGSRQFPLGLGQLIPQILQYPLRAAHPAEVDAQLRQPDLEAAAEVDVLPRRQPERQLGLRIHAQRDDRLLVLQRPHPLGLAGRMILHAVPGHEEKQARADLDGVPDLIVPVHTRPLVANVQPYRVRGRPGHQSVRQLPGELGGIDRASN